MEHKERVLKSLHHETTDRVPFFYRDIPEVEKRLLKDFQLNDREELLTFLDIDFRWVTPEYIGPPLENKVTGTKRDIWGVEYMYKEYSDDLGYWESVSHPLDQAETPEDLEAYPWPKLEWFDFSKMKQDLIRYKDYAIMTAPNDYASPGILQTPIQNLFGIEKAFMDMIVNPDLFEALVGKVMEFRLAFLDKMLGEADGGIDFFRIGDDFGAQNGMVMSPDLWRERIKPALHQLVEVGKKHGVHYYQHSCGAIRPIIPDFIEIGLEVLDPIQVTASGMDPAGLKKEFGDVLCFSGGVDEQHLLRVGSPAEVREGVKTLLDIMAPGGGYFLGPTHNFQTDIPTENIIAMYEAARLL
jgi:uroporphyrinogen decarboxylase